jgi:hypothetical protein
MKNLLSYASLLLVLISSCKQSDIKSETAKSVEGIYQAKTYDKFGSTRDLIPYPINGQTLTLDIKYVSTDTVSVQITPSSTVSLPDGVYSPSQTLVYAKAYIESPSNSAAYIYLKGKQGNQVSIDNPQIWIYKDKQSADYFFVPQQTPTIPKGIRFEKQ